MIYDNRKNTLKVWLVKFTATVVLTPMILFASFSTYFKNPVFGVDRTWYILGLALLYLLVIVYYRLKRPYFVFFADNGNKILMRYYPVRAINRKKNSIEIPKNELVKFEIQKKFPFREELFLYQKFRKGVGKYPPVNLSAVNKKDKSAIISALQKYIK